MTNNGTRKWASYPCRCLSRGFFLLMTNSLPRRRTIWQSLVRRFMLLWTFISHIPLDKVYNIFR